jgi:hypothetical protein
LGPSRASRPKLREVATYDYTDEKGELLFQVVRYEPKAFRQRRRVVRHDGTFGWEYKVTGVRRVLYRLPNLQGAERVLLVEGEKDVERVETLRFVATCNPGGACTDTRKWLNSYTESLRGKKVFILPDNDGPGQRHAEIVAEAIRKSAREVRLVTILVGKDLSDWIAAGATARDIEQAIAAAPVLACDNPGGGSNPPLGGVRQRQQAPPKLPRIQVNNRPFREVCEDATAAMTAFNSPPHLFVHGSRIVAIECTEFNGPFITEVDETKLRHHLSRAADYYRMSPDGRSTEVPPPVAVTRDILARNPATWPFPPLLGTVDVPTLRPDGTILAQPGYDPSTGLYLIPSRGMENIEVPSEPCRNQLDAALEVIRDAIGEFPFVDTASYANAVAALMTPTCRKVIDGPVPLALFDATTRGTGKTLLAEVITIVSTGRPASTMSIPSDEEESRKQLTSVLLEGQQLVVFDNISGVINSDVLAKVLTGDTHQDRILGRSKTVTSPIRCSWIATGNNIRLGADMPRRCFWIRMDARCPDPSRRTGFKHPSLKEYVLANRSELIRALLTIARAWYAAGRPKASTPSMGSFERWTEVVGGILEYVGVEGFLGNCEALFEQADIERSEVFLEAVDLIFVGKPFTIAQLWDRLNQRPEPEAFPRSALTEPVADLCDSIPADLARYLDRKWEFKQRVGIAFNQRREQRFGKRQLTVQRASNDAHSKVARWQVSSIG